MTIKCLPWSGRAALAAVLLAATAAPAQDAAPVAAPAPADAAPAAAPPSAPTPAVACEFHVWPGHPMKWVTSGWLPRNNNGPVYREGAPTVPPDPVDAAAQVEIMMREQPQKLFGKADYRLVAHDAALPSPTIRGATGRLSESASPCYAELIVDDLAFQQDPFSGSRLRTLFHYRDFGAASVPQRTFSTWGEIDLIAFPPRRQEQYESGMAEVRAAFRNNILAFAVHANRPPRRR